jgi:hypothetical protein
MGFWPTYGLGILSGLAIKFLGDILSPTIAELGAKLHAKVWKKPYIRGQLAEDLRTLESIEKPLLLINQIPRFPDSYKDTAKWLLEIDTSARKLRKKDFQDIKQRLIDYAAPMNQVGVNTSLNKVMELFIKDEKAFKLVEEIRAMVSKAVKEKKAKKK